MRHHPPSSSTSNPEPLTPHFALLECHWNATVLSWPVGAAPGIDVRRTVHPNLNAALNVDASVTVIDYSASKFLIHPVLNNDSLEEFLKTPRPAWAKVGTVCFAQSSLLRIFIRRQHATDLPGMSSRHQCRIFQCCSVFSLPAQFAPPSRTVNSKCGLESSRL